MAVTQSKIFRKGVFGKKSNRPATPKTGGIHIRVENPENPVLKMFTDWSRENQNT